MSIYNESIYIKVPIKAGPDFSNSMNNILVLENKRDYIYYLTKINNTLRLKQLIFLSEFNPDILP